MTVQQSVVKAVQDVMLETMHTNENILSLDTFFAILHETACIAPFEVTKHTPI